MKHFDSEVFFAYSTRISDTKNELLKSDVFRKVGLKSILNDQTDCNQICAIRSKVY